MKQRVFVLLLAALLLTGLFPAAVAAGSAQTSSEAASVELLTDTVYGSAYGGQTSIGFQDNYMIYYGPDLLYSIMSPDGKTVYLSGITGYYRM